MFLLSIFQQIYTEEMDMIEMSSATAQSDNVHINGGIEVNRLAISSSRF